LIPDRGRKGEMLLGGACASLIAPSGGLPRLLPILYLMK
jgi:hypothetical protein